MFWAREEDAFDKDWKAQGLLWINPPFSELEKVVNKIEAEGVECLLVCPNWPKSRWWEKAQELCAKARFFPAGSRLFETDKGKEGPTRWGVWVLYIPGKNPQVAIQTVDPSGGNEARLRLDIRLLANNQEVVSQCTALVDTGAEICLVKKGLIPSDLFVAAQRPVRLVGANGKRLEGGDREVTLTLCIQGVRLGTTQKIELRIPTTFHEAEIMDDAILGYVWCAKRGVDISPRRHGVICLRKGQEIWVEGVRTRIVQDADTLVQAVCCTPPKFALDLDTSSGGVGVRRHIP
jgi:hypothetical protein